jgi:hypothetical protein
LASHHLYHFRQLPERVQRQLVRAIADDGVHLLEPRHSRRAFYAFHVVAMAAILSKLYSAMVIGFGVPQLDPLWTDHHILQTYLLLLMGCCALAISLAGDLGLARLFGFKPGRYLFANTLVDARQARLVVVDLAQSTGFALKEHYVRDNDLHTTFTFDFADAPSQTLVVKGEDNAQKFAALQAEVLAATACNDLPAILRLDPFFEMRRRGWATSRQALVSVTLLARVLGRPFVAGILLALVLTPMAWLGRNALADVASHRAAQQERSEAAYLAYIDRGKIYLDEMRAALPQVAFTEAREKNSVTAMRAVLRAYPNSGLDIEGAAHIHALYQQVIAKFRERADDMDPVLLSSIEQLLALLEKRGSSRLGVRIVGPEDYDLRRLDNLNRVEEASFGRPVAPIALLLGSKGTAECNERLRFAVRSAFLGAFANDTLELYGDDTYLTNSPMLILRYGFTPTGRVYAFEDSGQVFASLATHIRVTLDVEDSAVPWEWKAVVAPPGQLTVAATFAYEAMAEHAFGQFALKMRRALVPSPGDRAAKPQSAQ